MVSQYVAVQLEGAMLCMQIPSHELIVRFVTYFTELVWINLRRMKQFV
jgi:hypothetical protein